jgi:hypothetical protein
MNPMGRKTIKDLCSDSPFGHVPYEGTGRKAIWTGFSWT